MILATVNFHEDELHGYCLFRDEKGKKIKECVYEHGIQNGWGMEYHDTKAYIDSKAVSSDSHIDEIHRHKYEVNQNFKDKLKNGGLILETIYTPRDGFNLTESAEYKNGRGFGVQFHPEFKSRMFEPHPLFNYFIKRCLDCHEKVTSTVITNNEVK